MHHFWQAANPSDPGYCSVRNLSMTTRWGETLIVVPQSLEDIVSSRALLTPNPAFPTDLFPPGCRSVVGAVNCLWPETKKSSCVIWKSRLKPADFLSSAIPEIPDLKFVDGAGVSLISHIGNAGSKQFLGVSSLLRDLFFRGFWAAVSFFVF